MNILMHIVGHLSEMCITRVPRIRTNMYILSGILKPIRMETGVVLLQQRLSLYLVT